jgi:heme exporter protein B
VFAIVWKDVRAELRTKDILSSMLVFAGLSVLIFQFAFDLRADNVRLVLPGVLWIAITFAGVLGLNRSFILEQDRGSLEGLLLAPVDRSAIYFGKLIGNLLFIFVVELLLLPLMTVLFNVWLLSPALLLVLALGTLGYAAVGTLFAALSINTRAREVMLPILLLDEPDTGLDQQAADMLRSLLVELGSSDRTVLLTTHNLERGIEWADRALILNGGRVRFDSATADLTSAEFRRIYTETVGGS